MPIRVNDGHSKRRFTGRRMIKKSMNCVILSSQEQIELLQSDHKISFSNFQFQIFAVNQL